MDATMRCFRFATLCLALLFVGAPAAAQNLRVSYNDIEGRDEERNEFDLFNLPLNLRECQADIEMELRIRNIPREASLLDFWRGTGSMCNEAEVRSDSTQTGCEPITIAADQNTNGQQEDDIIVRATELVPCMEGRTSEFDIFILAADSEASTSEVGSSYGLLEVKVDTAPPAAPTDLEGRDGENSFGASWETNDENLRQQLVFINTSGCGTGTGGGDASVPMDAGLDAGMTADAGMAADGGGGSDAGLDDGGTFGDLGGISCGDVDHITGIPDGFECAKSINGTSTSTSIDASSLPIGGEATIGIVGVDEAKNLSEMATTCVSRIDTTGFCEARGGCPDTCAVRAPGTAGAGAGPGTLAALVLAGALLAGRRRR